jgi:hypothetical protein
MTPQREKRMGGIDLKDIFISHLWTATFSGGSGNQAPWCPSGTWDAGFWRTRAQMCAGEEQLEPCVRPSVVTGLGRWGLGRWATKGSSDQWFMETYSHNLRVTVCYSIMEAAYGNSPCWQIAMELFLSECVHFLWSWGTFCLSLPCLRTIGSETFRRCWCEWPWVGPYFSPELLSSLTTHWNINKP